MKPDGDHFTIISLLDGREKGWIRYDVENGEDLRNERCFVIGRTKGGYYILVVRPTSMNGEYRRVGIGLVQSDSIVKERLNVRLV